ncbi:exopolygalacturonase-like [Hordeum vulgare]|nr:exopolygalacturonase-like [Hordeum vulgare]
MEQRPRPVVVAVNALLCVVSFCVAAAGAENVTAVTTYDAKNYGATGNGVDDDTKGLMAAWKAACGTPGTVTLMIPPGTYYIGATQFHGPCKASAITFLLQASTWDAHGGDRSKRFGNDWIEFGWVTDLTVAGQNGGIIDGQGAASWPFNKCPVRKDCRVLPTSVMFVNNENTVVRDITSVNSKFFHIALLHNNNMRMSNLRIHAPENSPNTDGIHIERNTGGNQNIHIARVHCGPGHGMSVGSLGRYVGEGDVTGIHVTDMTFVGTMNGVRVKTWENSPTKSLAAHIAVRGTW